LTVTAPPRPPRADDLEALFEEARQRGRKRRLGLLATAAILLGAAGSGFWLVNSRTAHQLTIAELERAVTAQAASSNKLILYVRSHDQQGQERREWIDLATRPRRWRLVVYAEGGPSIELTSFVQQSGKVRSEFVRYPARVWMTRTARLGNPNPEWPKGLGQANLLLSSGIPGTLLGREPIRGRPSFHLRGTLAGIRSASQEARTVDVWIDQERKQLVRIKLTGSKSGLLSTADFDWLPRTRANLAKLHLVVPAGFTHTTRVVPQRPRP
jgi:hypothetical protein